MKKSESGRKVEMSVVGLVIIGAWIAVMAVATDRLVKSVTTYERMAGTGDYSVDESEFSHL